MKTILYILFLHFFSVVSLFAQNIQPEYYKDASLQYRVEEKKARYKKTTSTMSDASVLTEVRELKNNTLYSLYRNEEPRGVWIQGKKTYDYDFNVNYEDTVCTAGPNEFKLNLANHQEISRFILRNINYPAAAEQKKIEGRVAAVFTVTASGAVDKIAIKKSAHIALDKELCRLLKLMVFDPVFINGTVQPVCSTFFLNFKLPE